MIQSGIGGSIVLGSILIAVAALAADEPAPTAFASAPYFRTLGVSDGLPSSTVWKLAQDRDGYIWIGTADGLARYDGIDFRVWRHMASDSDSLAGDDVTALFIDHKNRLWCGGEDAGLNLLGKDGAFTHFRHAADDPHSLGGDDVWAIGEDARGAIWVGTYAGGLDRLDESTKGFVHFRHDAANADSIASDNVLALRGDRNGNLWIGSDAGIDMRSADGHFRHVDISAVPGTGGVNAAVFLETADGMLAGTRRGLVRIGADLRAQVVDAERLHDKVVYGVAQDIDESLWIGTRDGLVHRGRDEHLQLYADNPAVPGSLPGRKLFDVLRDREGGLWFATTDGGLAYLAPAWRNFALFRHDPANAASLSDNRVTGIAADAYGLWAVNLAGGIDRIDPALGTAVRTTLSAPQKALWSVLADRDGRLWVGHAHGLRVYELQSGKFSDVAVEASRHDALARGTVDLLAAAADGAIWASANGGGVHRIDPATLAVRRFDGADGLRSTDIGQLAFAADGALLAAGAAGLDRLDAGTSHFAGVAGAPNQRVLAFAFAPDGSLWLHTTGALEHFRYTRGALQLLERIDAQDSWPSLTAGGMQVDGNGRVWVSSARGLWRVDAVTHAIRHFGSGDGLASAEFNRLPLLRTPAGPIVGATLAGIAAFEPTRIVENAALQPPTLESLRVRRGGEDIELAQTRSVDLRWDDRDLRLSVRALSYTSPAATRYQSRLKGFDRDWIDAGVRGEREFSQLPPGNYGVQLRVSGPDGAWSAPVAPLHLRVAAPPWATAWAYAAYTAAAAFALLLAFGAYRARIRRRHAFELAEQQRSFAENASAAKTEFLATMGHEIRTPMTGVLGMTELLLRTPLDSAQRGYADAIHTSGQMMLRLINDSLDVARIEAGKLELQSAPLDLHAIVHEVALLAEPLARGKGLNWTATIASDVPRHVLGDALRVKQVVLNLLNNAIKFTAAGEIALELARGADGAALFTVRDTGPGIASADQARLFQRFEQIDGPQRRSGSGLGLAICRELVARMGGEIALESTPGRGSIFCVRVPLAEVAAPVAEPPAAALIAATSAGRILLVEDDATVAAVVVGLLIAEGHHVQHVENALAALAELATSSYDVVFIDLDLPSIDGLTLARMIRTRASGAACPRLIGISARSRGDEEALCLDAGMQAFVRKPVTAAVLQSLIHQVASPATRDAVTQVCIDP
jgi:signal transduction histidine kinase/CheY-like chemotaxis protein/streptogramin lyase